MYGVIPADFSRFVATRYVAGGGPAYNGLVRLMRTSARPSSSSRRRSRRASRAHSVRDFHDTLHPNARGRRKIAGAVAGFLAPILRRRMQGVLPAAAPH